MDMLVIITVCDIDISIERVVNVVCSSSNIVDVFIPAKMAVYDDTKIPCVFYTYNFFLKKVRTLQACALKGNTNDLSFNWMRFHHSFSFPL